MSGENQPVDLDAQIYASVTAATRTGPDTPPAKDPAHVPDIERETPPAPEPEPEQPRKAEQPEPEAAAEQPAKSEPPPAQAKPAVAPPEPVKPAWDAGRQRFDQEAANFRRTSEALTAQVSELKELIARQSAEAVKAAQKPQATPADERAADEVLAAEKSIEEKVNALDSTNTIEDVKAVMLEGLKTTLRVRARTSGADDPQVVQLRTEMAELKRDREAQAEATRAAQQQAAQAKVDDDYDRHIAALKTAHGDHLYNDALLAVAEIYKEDGISAENPPPLPYAKRVMTQVFERLAREKPAKTRTRPPAPKLPRMDSGTGGTPAAREGAKRQAGKLVDVLADMDREGKFHPDYSEKDV